MGGIVFDVCLGDHVHLQERAEDVGIVVQDFLLKFYRKFCTLVGIELECKFFHHFIDFVALICTEVIALIGQAACCKEILRVAGRSSYKCRSVNIKAGHVSKEFAAVCRIVDVDFNAYFLQVRLHRFCQ